MLDVARPAEDVIHMNAEKARLTAISLSPLKSTAMRGVAKAYVGRCGLVGDREWMVVDANGAEVTAREVPALLRVVATNAATGHPGHALRLEAPGLGAIDLTEPDGEDRAVELFGDELPARAAGAKADEWLRQAVGRTDVRLVWCSVPEKREVRLGSSVVDHAAFQDESPVSLVSTASLAQLNEWIGDPVPLNVDRFRTNLRVAGVPPFAEDGWRSLRIGDAELRVAGAISRCVMTAIDPLTTERGKEPIRTLARHRRWLGQTWFAVHLLVDRPGAIAVGDLVEHD